MDNRTDEAAADYEMKRLDRAARSHTRTREFTVIALGHDDDQPFSFVAESRQACADQMTDRGIKLGKDSWAVGYTIGSNNEPMVYGNSPDLEQQLEEYLRAPR